MSEIVGVTVMLLSTLVPFVIAGVIIYFLVTKNKEKKIEISTDMLFQAYLHIISFLSLGIALIGAVTTIRGTLSYPFGIPFSYRLYKGSRFEEISAYESDIREEDFIECDGAKSVTIENNLYCFDGGQKADMINGLAVLVSMLIIFSLHQYALSKIKKEEKIKWLDKTYTFLSLIAYSIVGLIAIPVATYQLITFFTTTVTEYGYQTPEAPATAIGVVLFTLPLWLLFLKKSQKSTEKKK